MSKSGKWVEQLQERDAICAAILHLASSVKTSLQATRPGELDDDLDDRPVGDACVQLAQLIEDPALAAAIAHALRILWKRWGAEAPTATLASPAPRSFIQRLRGHLPGRSPAQSRSCEGVKL
jgi:hypothetical protein